MSSIQLKPYQVSPGIIKFKKREDDRQKWLPLTTLQTIQIGDSVEFYRINVDQQGNKTTVLLGTRSILGISVGQNNGVDQSYIFETLPTDQFLPNFAAWPPEDYDLKIQIKSADGSQTRVSLEENVFVTTYGGNYGFTEATPNGVPGFVMDVEGVFNGFFVSLTSDQYNAIQPGDTIAAYSYLAPTEPLNVTVAEKSIFQEMDWMTGNPADIYLLAVNGGENLNSNYQYLPLTINIAGLNANSTITVPASSVFNGKALVTGATSNPTIVEFRLENNDPLPVGSIIKMVSGQKFIKISGDVKVFATIPVTPDAEWGWDQNGIDAWTVLQSK